jgi:hypothetical protein
MSSRNVAQGVNSSRRFVESPRMIGNWFRGSPRMFFNNRSMPLRSLQYRYNLFENCAFSCQAFWEILRISEKVCHEMHQNLKSGQKTKEHHNNYKTRSGSHSGLTASIQAENGPKNLMRQYSIHQKKRAFFKLVAELCQFLGGSWKVIHNIQQLSQLLWTVNNRGSGLILSKKNIPAEVEGSKKRQKKGFFEKSENLWLWTNQCNWRAEKRGECADLVQD